MKWLTVITMIFILVLGTNMNTLTAFAESTPSPPDPIPTSGPGVPVPPISATATPAVAAPTPVATAATVALDADAGPVSRDNDDRQDGRGLLDTGSAWASVATLGLVIFGGVAVWGVPRVYKWWWSLWGSWPVKLKLERLESGETGVPARPGVWVQCWVTPRRFSMSEVHEPSTDSVNLEITAPNGVTTIRQLGYGFAIDRPFHLVQLVPEDELPDIYKSSFQVVAEVTSRRVGMKVTRSRKRTPKGIN